MYLESTDPNVSPWDGAYQIRGATSKLYRRSRNPLRTAVPFRGQPTQISSCLSPNRDCGPTVEVCGFGRMKTRAVKRFHYSASTNECVLIVRWQGRTPSICTTSKGRNPVHPLDTRCRQPQYRPSIMHKVSAYSAWAVGVLPARHKYS